MFDLITGKTRHMPRRQTVPMLVSTGAQLSAVGLIALSVLVATEQVPEIPTMMAFVAPAPPPPPPPPPPAPKVERQTAKPVPTTGAAVIPVGLRAASCAARSSTPNSAGPRISASLASIARSSRSCACA